MKDIISVLIWCVAIAFTIITTQYNSGVKEELSEIKAELRYMQYRDSMYAIYNEIPESIRVVIHRTLQSHSYIDVVDQYFKYEETYNPRTSLRQLLDENR